MPFSLRFLLIQCLMMAVGRLPVLGQSPTKDDVRQAWKHVPANMEESLNQLNILNSDSAKQAFAAKPEEEAVGMANMFMGMGMRNEWKLWRGSQLSTYFNGYGVKDPELMTYFILLAYHRKLHGQSFDLPQEVHAFEERVAWLRAHPPKQTDGFMVGDTVSGFRNKSKGFFDDFSNKPGYSIEVKAIVQEVDTIRQQLNVRVLVISSTERKTGQRTELQEYVFDRQQIAPDAVLWVSEPQWWSTQARLRKRQLVIYHLR